MESDTWFTSIGACANVQPNLRQQGTLAWNEDSLHCHHQLGANSPITRTSRLNWIQALLALGRHYPGLRIEGPQSPSYCRRLRKTTE
ncbi:hypothetical protein WG66_005877 [Moniliophthora roreri]|nr:hypothetical protein WG66_005877 [Moniliophthora roreri]